MANEPLRIIHCFRSPVGGIFRHVRDLVNYHHAQGHKIGIVCDNSTGGELEESMFDEIMDKLELGLVRMPIRRAISPSDFFAARKAYQQIKSLQPDIMHGHGAKGGAYVRILGSLMRGSRSRVTRAYSPHGGSLHYNARSVKGKIIFALEKFLERMTDAIIFVSDHERQAYYSKIGKPKTKNHLVYNGLNEEDFEEVISKKDATPFLYIGMMRDLKGPDIFIDAVRQTEQIVGHPLHATMVGDGPDLESYKSKINMMGMGTRIDVKPPMRAREAFALSKFVVIPSRAEAMPYIVLETIAAGKPILATNVGGIPEILGFDSEALVEPGDAQVLADKMARTLTEDGWLASVQPEREAFVKKFSVKTMAEDIMSVYRNA